MPLIPVMLTFLMLMVLVYDIGRYIIPNWLVALVALLWLALLWMQPAAIDWQMGLMVGAAAFVAGFLLFFTKLMGGGDVKLLAACCLWTGLDALLFYLLLVALLGGLLSLLLLFLRPAMAYMLSHRKKKTPKLPKVLLQGEPVPYGVAIAGAFLIVLWAGKLPGVAI